MRPHAVQIWLGEGNSAFTSKTTAHSFDVVAFPAEPPIALFGTCQRRSWRRPLLFLIAIPSTPSNLVHSVTWGFSVSERRFGPTLASCILRATGWVIMLKITVVETPTEMRLVLYGKLVGPWIGALQKVWENLLHQLGNRTPIVDLNDVTLIDDSADPLLEAMLGQGAELVASGLANRWLIEALKAGKTRVPARVLPPQPAALSHTVDAERNEVTTTAEGTVTLEEVRAHLNREKSDLALPYRELIDARHAVVKLSSSELQEIVRLLRSLARSHRLGRTAVVVSTDVAYGIMRVFQVLVEDVCEVQPFRDLTAADLWLNAGTR